MKDKSKLKTETLTLHLTKQMKDGLEAVAEEEGLTAAQWVRRAIIQAIKQQKEEK